MDELDFLDQRRADLSPVERALALSAAGDAKADAADRREEAARHAAAEHRTEALILANRAGGDVLGQLRRFRDEAAQADDECRDLADRLAKARERRDRLSECIRGAQGRLDEMQQAVSRSAPWTGSAQDDLLAPAKRANAEYVQATRAMLAKAQSGRPVRRPKEVSRSRGGGQAVRSENCYWCTKEGLDDETAFLLHSDPERPLAVTSAEEGAREEQADAGRAASSRRGEITRVVTGSGNVPMIYQ
jgi:hypothetical protein